RDGRVSVRELAAFVRARVDRWATNNRDRRQTPVLLGEAGDWELIALQHGRAKPALPLVESASYPDWLHAAWKLRDQWRNDDSWRLAPRTFQRLEATILRAEQRWRGNYDPERVQTELQDQRTRLQKEMDQARRAISRPDTVRSLALVSQKRPADNAFIADLKNLLLQMEVQTQGLKEDKAEGIKSKLTNAFLDKAKGRTALELAQAIFAVGVADPNPRPQRIRLLWQLVATRQPQPVYVETLFLRRLADLAEQMETTGWPEEIIHRALTVVANGEKAASQAAILPWIRPMLDKAAQDRHDAEVRLWGRGYASLDNADRLLKQALSRYETILLVADKVQQAMRRLDEAMVFLPAVAPDLDRAPEFIKSWFIAVEAASDLQAALAPPTEDVPISTAKILQTVETLWQKSGTLQANLDDLHWPFQPENLTHLAQQAARTVPSPALTLQIDAILNTPYLNADARAALWRAGREAARRRDEETLRLDREENRDHRVTPEAEHEAGARQHGMAQEHRNALDRGRRSIALLRLGGLEPIPLQALEKALDELKRAIVSEQHIDTASQKLGDALRRAWSEQVPTQLEQTGDPRTRTRLAWVVPPLIPVAVLDDPATNPRVQLQARSAANLWTWLADRYLYEFREAVALDTTHYVQAFYEEAASDYRQVGQPTPDRYVRLRSGPPALPLSMTDPAATYKLPLDLSASPALKLPLNLAIITADDDWLEVTAERTQLGEQPNLTVPARSWTVPLFLRMKPDAVGSDTPVPKGVLVEVTAGGRSYHYPVSLSLLQAANRVDVLLSANPQQPTDLLGDLRLRPLQTQQPIFLYVRNSTDKDRKTLIYLKANNVLVPGGEVKMDLPARTTQRVAFPPPAAPRSSESSVPSSETPNAKKVVAPLEELTGPLQVEVLDTANANAVLAKRIIRADLALPREYVRVVGIHFDPGDAATKRKNRLSVRLAARGTLPGPPGVVTLILPPDRIPGLLGVGAGNFRGVLPPDGKELTLFAESIRLAEGADEEGYVYLTVDSYPRALIFRTTFARHGNPVTPQEDDRSALRLRATRYAQPTTALAVTVETDNPPLDARLELSLGQMQGHDFNAEIVRRYPTARHRHIGFSPHGPGGALLFEASLKDWTDKLDVSEVRGECLLRARLLDRDGNEVRTAFLPVTVQDNAPNLVYFVHPPKQARSGTTLPVLATGADTASGISKVFFFLGKPVDDKVSPGTATIPGEKVDPAGAVWSGQVRLPMEKKGLIDLSVQFINGAGLSRFATVPVEVVDQLAILPGRIEGKVMEGALPQAALPLALQDERGIVRGNATTKADGSFVFDKVPPGKYKLSATKAATQRKGEAIVTVTADKATAATINLYR
ncbi:MAG TPA: carboxypeptidase-like regulatory domain-containing protein, partial [Gemmataceae bacterium]|nr:carboxypeptidase-like regulatory domain-containing protein [Gemmataceae bacterium]